MKVPVSFSIPSENTRKSESYEIYQSELLLFMSAVFQNSARTFRFARNQHIYIYIYIYIYITLASYDSMDRNVRCKVEDS